MYSECVHVYAYVHSVCTCSRAISAVGTWLVSAASTSAGVFDAYGVLLYGSIGMDIVRGEKHW